MVLGWDATLNVKMDLWAKEKIEEEAELLNFQIPFEGWTCYLGKRKIIKQVQLKLRDIYKTKNRSKSWSRFPVAGFQLIQSNSR